MESIVPKDVWQQNHQLSSSNTDRNIFREKIGKSWYALIIKKILENQK